MAYWAFVPHPLSPNLPVDWELTAALSATDQALSELAGLGRTMPNPHLLIGPFVRREAVLSSRIERTWADIADLYAYEAGQLPLPGMEASVPESDVREVLNYVNALEKYLHRDDVYPPLLRLGLVHYQFEAIHPFVDGNGRIGRLLLSLLLVQWDLLPLPLLCLSAYFHRHRQAYYDLLLGVSARGAWREWLLFFLRGVAEQALDAAARAKKLQDLQESWRARLTQAQTSALALRLADLLFENPILTIPQAQSLLKVGSYHSAQKTIEKLISAGILPPTDTTAYGKTYVAAEILEIVHHETQG